MFLLSFADDLVLIASTPVELQKLTDCLVKFCTENDLEISVKKTKAMYVNCNDELKIGPKSVETVK